jgi:hypothetical protein
MGELKERSLSQLSTCTCSKQAETLSLSSPIQAGLSQPSLKGGVAYISHAAGEAGAQAPGPGHVRAGHLRARQEARGLGLYAIAPWLAGWLAGWRQHRWRHAATAVTAATPHAARRHCPRCRHCPHCRHAATAATAATTATAAMPPLPPLPPLPRVLSKVCSWHRLVSNWLSCAGGRAAVLPEGTGIPTPSLEGIMRCLDLMEGARAALHGYILGRRA